MATFTPYQVDFSVKNAAKNLGFSKKRVSFKFGFADDKALQEGRNGPACRGSEHELTFVWSLGSGKRHLQLDGKDVHFSESGQNGWTVDHTWQHSFQLHDKATKRVYRFNFVSQPVNKERPDVRPFDLVVGGLSYFQFNPIYELGTPKMIAMPVVDGAAHRAASPISAEERRQLAAAKLASLQDLRQGQQPKDASSQASASGMKREEVSLINFEEDQPPPPPVPPANAYGQQRPTSSGQYSQYYASSMTMDPSIAENVTAPGSTVYGTNPYGAPPPPQPNAAANPYGLGGSQQQPPPQPYAAAPAPYGVPPQPPAGALPPSQASMNAGFQAPPPNSSGYPPAGPSAYPASGYPPSGAAAPYPPPQQPQQQPPGYPPYGGTNTTSNVGYQQQQPAAYGQPAQGGNMQQQQQQQQPYNNYSLTSPSAQTQFSYGSAPSFAQPPPQQQQQQPQQNQAYQHPPQQNAPQYPYSQGR